MKDIFQSETIENISEAGLISFDGDNYEGRTITSSWDALTIDNPNGVGGNPTIKVDLKQIDQNSLGKTSLSVTKGGTGKEFLAKNHILLGSGDSLQEMIPGNNGEVVIGSKGNAPRFGPLVLEGGLNSTPGSNSLTIKALPITVVTTGGLSGGTHISLGETLNLTTSPIKVTKSGGLTVAFKDSDGKPQTNGVSLGGTLELGAQPITITAKNGVTVALKDSDGKLQTNEVSLGGKLELTAEPITLVASDGIEVKVKKPNGDPVSEGKVHLGDTIAFSIKKQENVKWVEEKREEVSATVSTGYLVSNEKRIKFTLPVDAKPGDMFYISSTETSEEGWMVEPKANQKIFFGHKVIKGGELTKDNEPVALVAKGKVERLGKITSDYSMDAATFLCLNSGPQATWNVVSYIGTLTT